MPDRSARAEAACWAVAVPLAEVVARRSIGSRSVALLAAYGPMGVVAASRDARPSSRRAPGPAATLVGLGLTFGGYQLGRWLLGDAADAEPVDPLRVELMALGLAVPLAEELIWGSRVEPVAGIGATAATFALKHPLVDGRWTRTLGLLLFWTGLALLRRRSRPAAAAAHVVANSGAVLLGHLTRRDRF